MDLLKEIYPPKNDREREKLEQFLIFDGFLEKDHWRNFKSLYKAMEANPVEVKMLASMILQIENLSLMTSKKVQPSNKTIWYMKRRVRRFLRNLNSENQELYCELALELIKKTEISKKTLFIDTILNGGQIYPHSYNVESFKTSRDFYYHLMDREILDEISLKFATSFVLYGKSKHYKHINHGNGKVFFEFWHFRNHETGIPNLEFWKDFEFDYSTFFSTTATYPWYVYEFFYFVLREKGIAFESVLENNSQLKICLASPSNHLKIAAKNKVMQSLKEGKEVSFENISRTFTIENVENQNWIFANYTTKLDKSEKKEFDKVFIKTIISKKEAFSGKRKKKRDENIIKYIEKSNLLTSLSFKKVKEISSLIIKYGNPESVSKVFSMMSMDTLENLLTFWYDLVPKEDTGQWEQYFKILQSKFQSFTPEIENILPSILFHENKEIQMFTWQFVDEMVKRSIILNMISNEGISQEKLENLKEIPAAISVLRKELKLLSFERIRRSVRWNESLKTLYFSIKEFEEIIYEKAVNGGIAKIYYGEDMLSFIAYFKTESFIINLLENKKVFENIVGEMSAYWSSDLIIESFGVLLNNTENLWSIILKYTRAALKKRNNAVFIEHIVSNLTGNHKEEFKKWTLLILEQEDEIYDKAKSSIQSELIRVLERAAKNEENSVPLIDSFGFDFITEVFEKVSVERWIRWFGILTDSAWKEVEEYVFNRIETLSENTNIWSKILEIFYTEEGISEGYKTDRILENERMLELLYAEKNSFILEVKNPFLEIVQVKWIQKNKAFIQRNENTLFKITIHKSPKIRSYGYELMREEQPEINLLLRLAESGIPEVLDFTMELFESVKPNSPNEVHTILALCDSPNLEVRERGFAMVENRKETLDYSESNLLDCLAEHPDVFIQQKVAEAMLEAEENTPMKFAKTFDKQVMRQKNMGRKTKELVKNRLESSSDLDADMLLELANGKDKKDAEWAILQLTKMALVDENSVSNFKLI
ncbi:hypothetical protein [Aureivirga marina]|uniref:hypothetical protein n=1 Tax=Aureivirga marina TaxID=1182451 RepID=UPI0018CA968F|nr:hypothetical protein [Aureivirga marina]